MAATRKPAKRLVAKKPPAARKPRTPRAKVPKPPIEVPARMTTPKVDMTTEYPVTIAGKVYEAGVRDAFPVKPTGQRKRGYGYQVTYMLNRADAKVLVDIMAELGTPEDETKYNEALADQIQKDFSRFPEEVRPR